MFTSLLTLVESAHALTDTGGWAIITVLVLMQQTVGATMAKTANRCCGTILAGAGAVCAGVITQQFPPNFKAPFVALCLFSCTFFLVYKGTAPEWKTWQYALLLGNLTFAFLLILAYREDFMVSLMRIVMIVIGAVVALLVSLMPPRVTASQQLEITVRECLIEVSVAVQACVQTLLQGRRLHSLTTIDRDPSMGDPAYAAFKKVVVARASIEATADAAAWETYHNSKSNNYLDIAVNTRRVVYTVIALDTMLRVEPPEPLHLPAAFSSTLAEPLTKISDCMAMAVKVMANSIEEASEQKCSLRAPTAPLHSCMLNIEHLLLELKEGLRQYVQQYGSTCCDDLEAFALHVSFTQLVIQTAERLRYVHDAVERLENNSALFLQSFNASFSAETGGSCATLAE